jgi:hypothetical protein
MDLCLTSSTPLFFNFLLSAQKFLVRLSKIDFALFVTFERDVVSVFILRRFDESFSDLNERISDGKEAIIFWT